MPEVTINYLAVLIAAIASMVVGFVWYAPAVFGKPWMRLIGKTEEQLKSGNPGPMYIGSFVLALIMAYVLSHVLDYAQANTWTEGLQGGFWMWFGFVFTVGATNTMFGDKSWKLFAINNGYQLVSLLAMSLVVTLWA